MSLEDFAENILDENKIITESWSVLITLENGSNNLNEIPQNETEQCYF